MIVFPLIAGLLLAAAMAFVLVPLMRSRRPAAGATREGVNVAVHRDQLRELESDLEAGTITRERYDEAVQEIERRLLEDLDATAARIEPHAGAGRAALVVAMAVPFAAAMLYLVVGSPRALLPEMQAAAPRGDAHGPDEQQVRAMVERLAERMRAEPDNVQGWAMLARSYAVLGRFEEAAQAYANVIARVPEDAQLLADYADVLAMAQGRSLEGEPGKVIAKALAIDPRNEKALALAGSAAFARGDFKGAIAYWERLVRVAPESEIAQSTRASIEEARARAGTAASASPAAKPSPARVAASNVSVSGIVEIAPEIAQRIAPTDTLFVFARPAAGPRMPVAILRAQAKDLPLTFTLDDRSSVMGGARLSEQEEVIVGARLSKTGSAMPQPGDPQGYTGPVAPGASGLRIVLSDIVR